MVKISDFDARNIEPLDDFGPLVPGTYSALIEDTCEKSTRSGDGHYVEFRFQVIDGQYKGRKLWARLNLDNPNPTAVSMARAELSAICRAVGVMSPSDSSEIHDIPLMVKVKQRKRPDNGEVTNEIVGYASYGPEQDENVDSDDPERPPEFRESSLFSD